MGEKNRDGSQFPFYSLLFFRSSFSYAHINDIGYLEIRAFSARGLMAADLGGKSDPYAVFELDNAMLRTHTEYKTVAPVWNRSNLYLNPIRSAYISIELSLSFAWRANQLLHFVCQFYLLRKLLCRVP